MKGYASFSQLTLCGRLGARQKSNPEIYSILENLALCPATTIELTTMLP